MDVRQATAVGDKYRAVGGGFPGIAGMLIEFPAR
jgi:hypothetical protein